MDRAGGRSGAHRPVGEQRRHLRRSRRRARRRSRRLEQRSRGVSLSAPRRRRVSAPRALREKTAATSSSSARTPGALPTNPQLGCCYDPTRQGITPRAPRISNATDPTPEEIRRGRRGDQRRGFPLDARRRRRDPEPARRHRARARPRPRAGSRLFGPTRGQGATRCRHTLPACTRTAARSIMYPDPTEGWACARALARTRRDRRPVRAAARRAAALSGWSGARRGLALSPPSAPCS